MTQSMHRAPRLPSPAEPLCLLAMDHRDSFAKTVFGITGEPSPGQFKSMRNEV
jgi:hypothetical protein